MVRLLIIADDLTGAMDTGVQLAKQGIATLVRPELGEQLSEAQLTEPVLVLNTDSRHVAPQDAAARVRAAMQLGQQLGAACFYKKSDSTLRGNLGSELAAVLAATGEKILPFIPAFPQLKRRTKDGYQYLGEQLLHESSFAEDPRSPVTESYIPAVIKQQTALDTHVVRTATLPQFVREPLKAGVYLFDASEASDLAHIATALKRRGLLRVLAGAGAFAQELPALLGLTPSPLQPRTSSGPMLLVSGSLNPVSLAQVAAAEGEGLALITLTPEILVPEAGATLSQAQAVIMAIVALMQQKRDVVLRSLTRRTDFQTYLSYGAPLGLSATQLPGRVATNLGYIVAEVLAQTDLKQLVVFGGDTLLAIARALNWAGLRPQTEIVPGVVVAELAAADQPLCVVTKAGGFGDLDVVARIRNFLGSEL